MSVYLKGLVCPPNLRRKTDSFPLERNPSYGFLFYVLTLLAKLPPKSLYIRQRLSEEIYVLSVSLYVSCLIGLCTFK